MPKSKPPKVVRPPKPKHMTVSKDSSSAKTTLVVSIVIAMIAISVTAFSLGSVSKSPTIPSTSGTEFIPKLEPLKMKTTARTAKSSAETAAETDEEIVSSTTNIGVKVVQTVLENSSLELAQVERVSLKGNDHLLIRLGLSGLDNSKEAFPGYSAPETVIVKRFEPANFVAPSELKKEEMLHSDSYRHATLDFLREARALALLNNTLGVESPYGVKHHTFLAPLSYGSDLETGTIVMQDLGGIGIPLYEAFGVFFRKEGKAEDVKQAFAGSEAFHLGHTFARIGEAFARLHSPELVEAAITTNTAGEDDRFAWLHEVSRYHDFDLFENSATLVREIFRNMEAPSGPALELELSAISDALLNPGPWLSMTHGDVCADNIFLMKRGARTSAANPKEPLDSRFLEPMLLDFSSSGLRHRLADLATFHLLFPTCWCAGDIAAPFTQRLTDAYRHALLGHVRQLMAERVSNGQGVGPTRGMRMDLAALERELRSDESFNRNLVQMAGFHLVVSLAEYWDDALEDRRCGHVPCRAHVLARLSAFLKLATQLDQLPALVSATERLYLGLRQDLWPPPADSPGLYALPPFPAFARMSGNPRQAAARQETRRLMKVSAPDALRLFGLGSPIAVEVRSGRKDGALQPVARVVGEADRPVKVEGAEPSTWPAVAEWTSLARVAEQARGEMRWVIKKRGLEREGTRTRFPIGCCETFRASAAELVGHSACLLDDCGQRLPPGLHSPYYASVLIMGNGMAAEASLAGRLGPLAPLLVDRRPGVDPIVNIWAASAGSITPLHYDPFHNTFVQVSGRKRFLLVPPRRWQAVYVHPRLHLRHRQAQLNLNDIDLARFPLAAELAGEVQSVEVGPGDVLYVPPYWFHQVESLEDTVSVSIFTDSVELDTLGADWEMMLPLDEMGGWTLEQVTSCVKVFLKLVLEHAVGSSSGAFESVVSSVLATRYSPALFEDSLSAELEPELPVAPAASAIQEGQVPDPHLAQYQMESKEEQHCLLGKSEWCSPNVRTRAELAKRFCKAGEAFEEQQASLFVGPASEFAAKLTKVGGPNAENENSKSIHMIILENFVEDLAAKTVGDSSVFLFLQACLHV